MGGLSTGPMMTLYFIGKIDQPRTNYRTRERPNKIRPEKAAMLKEFGDLLPHSSTSSRRVSSADKKSANCRAARTLRQQISPFWKHLVTRDHLIQFDSFCFANKVTATMVIRPLGDRTCCAQSAFIRSFGVLAKAVRLFIGSLQSRPMCPKMCSIYEGVQKVLSLAILGYIFEWKGAAGLIY